jgi:hypothetical protein
MTLITVRCPVTPSQHSQSAARIETTALVDQIEELPLTQPTPETAQAVLEHCTSQLALPERLAAREESRRKMQYQNNSRG